VSVSVTTGAKGERYHLGEDIGAENLEVAYRVVKVGLAATVHWNPWFHSRLYGGATVARRFEVFKNDDSQGDLKVETGPYAGVELVIGPSGWKSDAR
jgi:hypothetical protein